MPEIIPNTPYIRDVRSAIKNNPNRPHWWQKIAKRLNSQNTLVGSGSESFVVVMPNNPNKVASISYRDIDRIEASRLFYAGRVLNILFPHNFPHVYSVFGKSIDPQMPDNTSGRIMDRIKPRKNQFMPVYSFGYVRRICEELNIPLHFENHPGNFIVGEDGGEYFVDKPLERAGTWDRDKILKFMQSGFSKIEIKLVTKALRELNVIAALP